MTVARPLQTPATGVEGPLPGSRCSPENRPPARPGDEVTGWLHVCPVNRLQPGRGAAALVGGIGVAVFRLAGDVLHVVGNVDPFTGAGVISRGIVGDRNGVATVASPVYKQAFSLADGHCLDDGAVHIPVYRTRVHNGDLQIGLRAAPGHGR